MADAGLIIDGASGIPLIALALFVATRRPPRAANMLFAGFSGMWGISKIGSNWLRVANWDPPTMYILSNATFVVTGLFLLALASRVPPGARRGLLLPAGAGALYVAEVLVSPQADWTSGFFHGNLLIMVAAVASVAAIAGRYARADRMLARLMTSAIALDAGLRTGIHVVSFTPGGVPCVAVLAFASVLWLRHSAAADTRGEARATRNVALLLLFLPLAGMLLQMATPGDVGDAGLFGVARILVVAVLAYAILRHQLLGIDVRVKWTLKQSTVAAIFVGLFFVVSEAAAQFFSERVGAYMGIVAAGALVFAIAPLQHFAQRVADRAMPGVKEVDALSEDDRAAIYRRQAEAAWHDGALSRDERVLLDRLRQALSLPLEEASAIEASLVRQ